MLDAGVLALRVLPDKNGVDVVIRCLEALDRKTRTNVGEEVEGSAKRQVQGNVSLADFMRRLT